MLRVCLHLPWGQPKSVLPSFLGSLTSNFLQQPRSEARPQNPAHAWHTALCQRGVSPGPQPEAEAGAQAGFPAFTQNFEGSFEVGADVATPYLEK